MKGTPVDALSLQGTNGTHVGRRSETVTEHFQCIRKITSAGVLRQCSVSMRWQFSKVPGTACATAGCVPVTKQVLFYSTEHLCTRVVDAIRTLLHSLDSLLMLINAQRTLATTRTLSKYTNTHLTRKKHGAQVS